MIEKNKIREFIQIVVIFFLFFQHGAALYRYEIADYRNFLVYLSIVLILYSCCLQSSFVPDIYIKWCWSR